MAVPLANIDSLASDEFNSAIFLSAYLQSSKQGDESKNLNKLKQVLRERSNTSSETIKDNVFEHYKHFIEASREISSLESEVQQLSALLNEQKASIVGLMEMCGERKQLLLSDSSITGGQDLRYENSLFLIQKIDGIAAVLNNMRENEKILMHPLVTLLDSDSLEQSHQIYLILTNNNLFVARPSKIESNYEFFLDGGHDIKEIAVLNVKGSINGAKTISTADNVLQLLMFPDQIYIKCDSARIKRELMDAIDDCKRQKQQMNALQRQATIREKRRNILTSFATSVGKKSLQERKMSRRNSKSEFEELAEEDEFQQNLEDIQWLNDLVNELNDVISHRDMEQAIEMVMEWKSCRCKDPTINDKFAAAEKMVIQILADKIKCVGALHGGPRVLVAPMQQLISLGKIKYSVDLFLKRHSAELRSKIKELPISEEPLSYVRQVSDLVVHNIIEVSMVFEELSIQKDEFPSLLYWASRELSILVLLVRRHVIEVVPTMAVLANTWRILVSKCSSLSSVGADLSFELHMLAAPSLRNALEVNISNITDSIQLRVLEERWEPFVMENEQTMNRFLEEMSDLGLSLDFALLNPSASPRRFRLHIYQSACQFSRVALSLAKDLAVLNFSNLKQTLCNCLESIWTSYLSSLSEKFNDSDTFVSSCKFLFGQVLPLCDNIFQNVKCDFLFLLVSRKFPVFVTFLKTEFDEVASV